jgi:negative regulator of sigma E activity
MFMKTFEEKFTAWVDGQLKGRELSEFELELANVKDAQLDKLAVIQIGDLFREHGRAPELKNEDFFNHQLMQQIEAELPKPAVAPLRRKFAWSLPRLAMAGAFSLLVAFGLFHTLVPKEQPAASEAQGVVQVINTKGGQDINVTPFYSQQDKVDVFWLGGPGLKYVPDKRVQTEKHKEK